MPNVRLLPTLVALPVALLLTPPAHAQVLADGHVDYAARLVDGRLRSLIKDGTGASPVWREPAAVTFAVADAARTTVPASTPFLGRPGDTVWVLPQVQRTGVLWAGWNTEELGSAQVDGPVAWRLDSVSGPGHVTLFQTGVFGEPDVLFSSADGLPDSRSVPLGTHAHGNWVFTREGAYRLTFTMSARLTGGATSQDTQTLAVQVGAATTPEPATTPTPTPGATPAPAPTAPPQTGTAPAAPTLRTLAASVRGRTLTLRVRLDRTSRVSVTLRRKGKTSARTKARTLRTGTRTVRLSLDRRPKAGRHTVRVTATADGRSATRTRTLRVR
jgi:surface-anchored protein